MATGEQGHNGWRNYETWLTHLWLSNDESTYRACCELAADCQQNAKADGVLTQAERARFDLADRLRAMVEDGNPLADRVDLYSDLLNAAIGVVDWGEIAEAFEE